MKEITMVAKEMAVCGNKRLKVGEYLFAEVATFYDSGVICSYDAALDFYQMAARLADRTPWKLFEDDCGKLLLCGQDFTCKFYKIDFDAYDAFLLNIKKGEEVLKNAERL